VQLRRALIAFAVVFVAVTAIAALSSPREEDREGVPASRPAPTGAPATIDVAFRHPVGGTPPARTVRRSAHVVVRVEAGTPGDVEIAGLGLIQPAAPGAPALFDLLPPRAGRFDVSLRAAGGERIPLGTLVVVD
jgi:hypothetical protein